ncbi:MULTISPECIES: DoxX family protein [Rossellomorea]|uniref:DoxX family protein n=1 Tax=Rossellomorea TaxID=2837508 RepID=UPI001CC9FAD0|nr:MULTISPECIES: DoxX family protein [Rossellomorea]MCA0150683.1 DoxX family protein [Rossellomorea vietnamensis]UTE77176.1 DoxX family protein [Rossellomorea sp. KS-H15a]WGG45109.1 DoxX family protein [Rossellomorea sp. DA94]
MNKRVEWSLLIGRVVLGMIMVAHGMQKIMGMEQTIEMFDQIGLPAIMAYTTAIIEAVGGLMLIIGFYVIPSAAALAVTMLGAIVLVKFKLGLIGGYEFPLVLLALSVMLSITGSDKWSVMSALNKQRQKVTSL